jgi:hypothetical protein
MSSPMRPIRGLNHIQRQNLVPLMSRELMSRDSQEPITRGSMLYHSAASHSPFIPEIPPNSNTDFHPASNLT